MHPKTLFLAYFGIIEGIAILFQYPKWIEFGIQDQLLGLKKIKTVSNIPDSFWGQKWPIFAPKTAFLAYFGIIEGIAILLQYPKWIELGILDQLLGLEKIKTVSNTPDSF